MGHSHLAQKWQNSADPILVILGTSLYGAFPFGPNMAKICTYTAEYYARARTHSRENWHSDSDFAQSMLR